jgi:ADP-ribosylglycohydrolase
MLVELAIGDAYGAGFEYADPKFIAAHNTLQGYVQHPKHDSIKPGAYTDDTQMTLAIAELLADGASWTAESLADKFVEVFKRDKRQGYAGGFYLLLCDVQSGAEFLRKIRPDSDKSGAAMRSGPIGLLPTVPDVMWHAAVQARVTHDTPDGIAAAQAAALAVHYCHFELGPVAQVAQWIARELETSTWAQPWRGKVGSKGWMSTRAALTALASNTSMSEILRTSVAFTGDVDTVATIALAAAARSPQITQDLPEILVQDLENGKYGRDHLQDLDRRLRDHFS